MRSLLLLLMAAWLAGQASAADREALHRVTERLQMAAAPWCDRLAEIGPDGRRRCTVPMRVMDAGDLRNAMAFLGNHYVTDAMLALLDEDELAHVLGHELAHTVLAHATVTLRRDPALHKLLPLVEIGLPLPHDEAAATPHEQELDADALGLYFAGLAGYPVRAQQTWWLRMPALLPEWNKENSSHPLPARRAAAAAAQARRFCAQLSAGELLQPDAARLRIAYENREDELRLQQRGLDAARVCR